MLKLNIYVIWHPLSDSPPHILMEEEDVPEAPRMASGGIARRPQPSHA